MTDRTRKIRKRSDHPRDCSLICVTGRTARFGDKLPATFHEHLIVHRVSRRCFGLRFVEWSFESRQITYDLPPLFLFDIENRHAVIGLITSGLSSQVHSQSTDRLEPIAERSPPP